jgi:hypothetical protein
MSQDLHFHVQPDAWLPVAELRQKYHPNNSQIQDEREMDAIKASIQAEGFTAEIIIVNSINDKLVSGHGRTEACWQLGYRGTLPVIYKQYETDLDHRLAMLRWNKARGHLDPVKEQEILADLLQHYADGEVGKALAYTDEGLQDAVSAASSPGLSSDISPQATFVSERENWPWIKVEIPPEAHSIYIALLWDIPGIDWAFKFDQILRAVDQEALGAAI